MNAVDIGNEMARWSDNGPATLTERIVDAVVEKSGYCIAY
jgi:hypothetical protein